MQYAELPKALQSAVNECPELATQEADEWLKRLPPTLTAQLTTLDEIETVSRQLTQWFGQRVTQGLTGKVVQTLEPSAPACPTCTLTMRKVDHRIITKLGMYGKYQWRRAYYVCPAGHGGQAPTDVLLGLGPERFTGAVAQAVTAFAVTMPFDRISDLINMLVEIPLDGDTIRRMVERVGDVAEAAEQAAITAVTAEATQSEITETDRVQPEATEPVPPARESVPKTLPRPVLAPHALVVSVDGVMAPFRLGHSYHEVKVAVCEPLQRVSPAPTAPGISPWLPLHEPDFCLGLEPRPAFWARVRAHALQQGLTSPTCGLVVLLGDGADWIWHDADRYLRVPGSVLVKILDIFHAREHLWAFADSYFDTASAAHAWAEPLNARLETEGPGPILTAMAELEAQHPGADPKKVAEHHGYFMNQADRMDYPRYTALGLPIGSGTVECACRTLVKQRLDAGGMWWLPRGIQSVGTLRALYRSGKDRWQAFWAGRPYAAERGHASTGLPAEPSQVA